MIAPEMLADGVRTLLCLPRLEWSEDRRFGMTGVASGTDTQIRLAVWAWAQAFRLEPIEVSPEPVHRGWRTFKVGWIAVELPILGFGVTVAGRLTGKGGGR